MNPFRIYWTLCLQILFLSTKIWINFAQNINVKLNKSKFNVNAIFVTKSVHKDCKYKDFHVNGVTHFLNDKKLQFISNCSKIFIKLNLVFWIFFMYRIIVFLMLLFFFISCQQITTKNEVFLQIKKLEFNRVPDSTKWNKIRNSREFKSLKYTFVDAIGKTRLAGAGLWKPRQQRAE